MPNLHPIDISVVVTSHNEGLIAHKTILSILQAAKRLEKENLSYEIIVSIDNGDKETLDYFKRYADNPIFRVLEVSFKDLSESRNNAAASAHGDYIAFIDADDLMSENWLTSAYAAVKDSPGSIVHPEYSITFGDDNLIWQKRNSNNDATDILGLIDNNQWDSPAFAEKRIFINTPYVRNGNGFGFEDKHFNSETLSKKIPHIVAPETILFVRRKLTGSMLRESSSDWATLAPTSLLSFENVKKLKLQKKAETLKNNFSSGVLKESVITHGKKGLKLIHKVGKKSEIYNKAIEPLRRARHEKKRLGLELIYPVWMTDAWKSIHKIDNSTFPAKDLLFSLPRYNSQDTVSAEKYIHLVQQFPKQPDTLFFVPHLIKGGADMLFINYANELHETRPDWNIAVLQTEQKTSVWGDKLNKDIPFINLFDAFSGLNFETQYRLLATVVTQNNIKRIVVGNSQLAYDFLSRHQTLINRLGIAIYCFAFGEEFDEEGRLWGHIHTGIPRIYPIVRHIITDNKNTVTKLQNEYGYNEDKFRVHYQPTTVIPVPSIHNTHKPIRILWASRVCKQKRPDILKAVSNKLDSDIFSIDAYGQLEEGLTEQYFNDSKVTYKGPFNGIASIPTTNYDVYFYTSEGDGVPNVLQEMTASGLPIVASNVGGIKEFIMTGKTGILIEDHENIDDYVAGLKQYLDSDFRTKMNIGAQKLLSDQFSKKTWKESIAKDIDL